MTSMSSLDLSVGRGLRGGMRALRPMYRQTPNGAVGPSRCRPTRTLQGVLG